MHIYIIKFGHLYFLNCRIYEYEIINVVSLKKKKCFVNPLVWIWTDMFKSYGPEGIPLFLPGKSKHLFTGTGTSSPDHYVAEYVKTSILNCSCKRTWYGTTYVIGDTNSLNLNSSPFPPRTTCLLGIQSRKLNESKDEHPCISHVFDSDTSQYSLPGSWLFVNLICYLETVISASLSSLQLEHWPHNLWNHCDDHKES